MRITKYNVELNEDLTPELVKDVAYNYSLKETLTAPKSIAIMLNDVFRLGNQAEEHLYLVCLNSKGKVAGIFENSHGGGNLTFADPRTIFIQAVLCGAINIIMAHNHPSQDVSPSKQDIDAATRIKKVGELLNIPLVDSIIVSNEEYFSFMEKEVSF